MCELCGDLLGEEMLHSMSFNDGAGPEDQETCTQMADRFDRWLEHHTEGTGLDDPVMHVDEQGRFVDPGIGTRSPYQVGDEHLKEWVEFLRHCGGFQVF
jgi:hypothetical protein